MTYGMHNVRILKGYQPFQMCSIQSTFINSYSVWFLAQTSYPLPRTSSFILQTRECSLGTRLFCFHSSQPRLLAKSQLRHYLWVCRQALALTWFFRPFIYLVLVWILWERFYFTASIVICWLWNISCTFDPVKIKCWPWAEGWLHCRHLVHYIITQSKALCFILVSVECSADTLKITEWWFVT